jgi:hypothetical protein
LSLVVLFNLLVPVHLARGVWRMLDLAGAGVPAPSFQKADNVCFRLGIIPATPAGMINRLLDIDDEQGGCGQHFCSGM